VQQVYRYLAVALIALGLGGACAPPAGPAPPRPTVAPPAAAAAAQAPAAPAAQAAPPTSAPREPERVTVAWVRSLNIAPYNVAVGRGYYTQEGLAVETAEFASTADVVSALGTGQTDVNVGAISAGNFNAWQRGVKMYVVAALSVYPAQGLMPTNVITRKELYDSGAVRGLPDLRGRPFAVNARGNITEYTLWRVLQRRDMGLDDLNTQIMGFPDMVAALANGSVDAFIASEPFGTIALDQGTGARLEEDQQTIGAVQFTHTLYSEQFADSRSDAATRFLKATLRASRELQGTAWINDPTVAQILEAEIGFKAELLGRSILPVFPTDLTARIDDVEQMQEGLMRMGRLSYPTPLDVRPFVNTTLAQHAREQLEAGR
jgi:ABC-type nitrate/sulfonate/bicarbonate transport system substrate-binding protein